jgi:hypothetical protein
MANNPQYANNPIFEITQITTANTARDGTGTMSVVCAGLTAAASAAVGKRISRVAVTASGTNTAGVVRFFGTVDGGTTRRLMIEKLIPANTPSTSNTVVRFEVPELIGLVLPGAIAGATSGIFASTNAGETFGIFVESASL